MVKFTDNVINIEEGEPIIVVNFEDITEQIKNQEDLIESENYLDQILNSVSSGVLLIDPETHQIVDINDYALTMFKQEKADVIGRECFDIICQSAKGNCPITDQKKSIEESVCELYDTKGTSKYILKNVKKIEVKGKVFLLETFTDIDEQVKTDKELKKLNENLELEVLNRTKKLSESEEKFKTLFQASRDAIVLVTTNGFFDCNQAALEMYGYKNKSEFLKLHPANLSPQLQPSGENSFNLANKYIKESMKKKLPMFEWVHKKKNGELIHCEIYLSPITFNNEKAVHALIRDITERKKTEEIVRKSEEKFRKLTELSPSAISIQRKNKYY